MAKTFLEKKNNAKSTLAGAIDNDDVSISLTTGQGTRFPTGRFLATIYDAVTYSDPSDDPNMEVVLCDSRSTDTVTVNAAGRGYAGTTGVSHAIGSAFRLLIMKEHADEWEGAIFSGWTPVRDAWAYASADDPTFVITVPSDATTSYSPGMRVKLTQSTVKYFIITAVSATTITVYGGTDYTLANAAISAVSVSSVKAPFGFPLNPTKWTFEATSSSLLTQASPVNGTYYNLGSFNLFAPIGIWRVQYQVLAKVDKTSATTTGTMITSLSTSASANSDTDFNAAIRLEGASGNLQIAATLVREKILVLTVKTTYYLVAQCNGSATNISLDGRVAEGGPLFVRLVSAYL